jgi:hypothetical protein
MRSLRLNLLGMEIADAEGATLGHVVDTYPFDGGGELELVILRMRRFGERRMIPIGDLRFELGRLVAPYDRRQVEDSPALSTNRHAEDDPYRAKAYWRFEEPAEHRIRW